MKKIIVINGCGGVGKDTFVELCSKHINLMNFSSVEKVKEVAKICGWDGKKDELSRKFLSDLKDLTENYNSMPYQSMVEKIGEFKRSTDELLFLHVREPEQISRLVEEFDAKSLLIVRNTVAHISSNHADDNVFNYKYDYVIQNDGTLEELEEKAIDFIYRLSWDVFYFTFGTSKKFPFHGGWVEVHAKDLSSAEKLFSKFYPGDENGILPYAGSYTKNEFYKTGMQEKGNRGAHCHDILIDSEPFMKTLESDKLKRPDKEYIILWLPGKKFFIHMSYKAEGIIHFKLCRMTKDMYLEEIKHDDYSFYPEYRSWKCIAEAVPEVLYDCFKEIPRFVPFFID